MGRDKAMMSLEPNGPSLLAMAIERAGKVASDVMIIAPAERGYGGFGPRVIPDAFPGAGVLGGIATGLLHANGDDLLVVACDHPFLSVALLAHVAAVDEEYDVLIPRTRGESRQGGKFTLQTLHAIYRPSCLDALRNVLAHGYVSAASFFSQVDVRPIDEPELRAIDPDLLSLFSANTPESFDAARRLAREQANRSGSVDYTQESE